LRLNAHGFGILVLGQTIWFVSVGVLLFNDNPIAAWPKNPGAVVAAGFW